MRTFTPLSALLTASLLALPIQPFSCALTSSSITYDLTPLSDLRTVSKNTPTPPTTSTAKVRITLCSEQGVPPEQVDGPEEDEVGLLTSIVKS